MDQSFDLSAYVAALKRRWLLLALPIVLLTPIAVAVAFVLPPVYSASARILVESQQIPTDLARSTVSAGVAERIALIEQRLMTRQNLLDLAERFNVTDGLGPKTPAEIVTLMRGSTRIQGVRLAGARGPVTGVDVSFTASRPHIAASVTNELVTLIMRQNIQQRTSRAFETSAYFRNESERLAQDLDRLEREVTDFKIRNEYALPDSLDFRRAELASLQDRVFERELRQIELREQAKQLEEALAKGDFSVAARPLTPEEEELARLRRSLIERRSVYSDTHPIVRSLQQRIDVIEQRVTQTSAVAPEAAADPTAPSGGSPAEQVRAAIAAILDQIEKVETRRAAEVERIAELEKSIADTPAVELALNNMMRALSLTRAQYSETVQKLSAAETGERLEVNQQAERFEIIENAVIPSRPSSPNRPLIMAAGFVGAAGVGFGLVVLAELLNRSVRTAADIERRLSIRPIVVIPYIETRRQTFWRRWRLRLGLLGAFLFVVGGMVAVDRYYLPLPLVAEKIMDMTGLNRLTALIDARLR